MTILQVRAPAEQKSQPLTHESSSVGARPSSAASVEQNPQMGLSLPLNGVRKRVGPISTGAAEDGRAPTEELSCVRG